MESAELVLFSTVALIDKSWLARTGKYPHQPTVGNPVVPSLWLCLHHQAPDFAHRRAAACTPSPFLVPGILPVPLATILFLLDPKVSVELVPRP